MNLPLRITGTSYNDLNVRKVGKNFWRYGLSRVLIHMRGLDNMMLDMYDNPELLTCRLLIASLCLGALRLLLAPAPAMYHTEPDRGLVRSGTHPDNDAALLNGW